MIVWENGHGQKRYQPVRCDGARWELGCGMTSCFAYWHEGNMGTRRPKVYRWRWRARLRERIGSWFYRRADLKRIHPVV